jgi:hypothetical protein
VSAQIALPARQPEDALWVVKVSGVARSLGATTPLDARLEIAGTSAGARPLSYTVPWLPRPLNASAEGQRFSGAFAFQPGSFPGQASHVRLVVSPRSSSADHPPVSLEALEVEVLALPANPLNAAPAGSTIVL